MEKVTITNRSNRPIEIGSDVLIANETITGKFTEEEIEQAQKIANNSLVIKSVVEYNKTNKMINSNKNKNGGKE